MAADEDEDEVAGLIGTNQGESSPEALPPTERSNVIDLSTGRERLKRRHEARRELLVFALVLALLAYFAAEG